MVKNANGLPILFLYFSGNDEDVIEQRRDVSFGEYIFYKFLGKTPSMRFQLFVVVSIGCRRSFIRPSQSEWLIYLNCNHQIWCGHPGRPPLQPQGV